MTAEQIRAAVEEVKTAYNFATNKEAMDFIEKVVLSACAKLKAK
jgi:hypothetical protein